MSLESSFEASPQLVGRSKEEGLSLTELSGVFKSQDTDQENRSNNVFKKPTHPFRLTGKESLEFEEQLLPETQPLPTQDLDCPHLDEFDPDVLRFMNGETIMIQEPLSQPLIEDIDKELEKMDDSPKALEASEQDSQETQQTPGLDISESQQIVTDQSPQKTIVVTPKLTEQEKKHRTKRSKTPELDSVRRPIRKNRATHFANSDTSSEEDNPKDDDYPESVPRKKRRSEDTPLIKIQKERVVRETVEFLTPDSDALIHVSSIRPLILQQGDQIIYKESIMTVQDYGDSLSVTNLNGSRSTIPLTEITINDNLLIENKQRRVRQTNNRLFRGFGFALALSQTTEDGQPIQDRWISEQQLVHDVITTRGGKILSRVDQYFNGRTASPQSPVITLLIANRPARRSTYLTALALGIKIVSLLWLKTCDRLLDYELFLMPTGISAETGYDICPKYSLHVYNRYPNPKTDKEIKMDKKAKELQALCESAGCTSRKQLKNGNTDYVIFGFEPTEEEMHMCKQHDCKPVKTEWVVQCLINQRFIEPANDSRYIFSS
ncbi:hypothetical protein EDD86DRAFT_248452 [Gorgonomyces haynaldii]|nr:hypothetical protein EDD86DRAFT_248452 [Gorgonomyces haynaldii]